MVKYEYRPDIEMFKRVDNRGPALKFNIVEAKRIESMLKLGNKVPTIYSKIEFVNNVSMTNLRTFVENLNKGNINLKGDYPAPRAEKESLDVEVRVARLESEVEQLKKQSVVSCNCEKKSFMDKIRGTFSNE